MLDDTMDKSSLQPATLSVHAGELYSEHYPITTPIFQTSTYYFAKTKDLHDFFQGKSKRIAEYGRYGNPTQKAAEKKLAALDKAEACLLCSSGMNAITSTIISMCRSGDHIIITDDSYRRTRQFIMEIISKFNIQFSFVKPDIQEIQKVIKPSTRLLISESPTNPYLYLLDIQKVADICKQHSIKSIIDSTIATPYNQNPIEFGIDIVIHSVTKYLAGHNDILGGAILGKSHLISAISDFQSMTGGIMDPHACYLLIRGLKTFALRLEHQNQSALEIARTLEKNKYIKQVWYPGLPSHPHHAIARKQMKGFGGVISFMVDADIDKTSKFIDCLQIPKIAPSMGGVESLIEQPALMSYYELSNIEREKISIFGNLVRLSVGIEDTSDLVQDIEKALNKALK